MLSLQGILDFLNKKDRTTVDPVIYKWRQVYYGMSLHIDGITPAYRDLRYGYVTADSAWIFSNYYTDWRIYQDIFETRLFSKYPREAEETRQWRLSQYKPFTQDPMQRCMQTVTGAIFQDSGYSVTVEDRADNEYIWGANFEGKSLVHYFADKFQNICEDPNGLFVTIPKEAYYETTTSKVEPHIHFIPSKFILKVTKDEIIFELNNFTWAVNSIGFFRFLKDGEKFIHYDEQYGGYYAHMMGKIPHMVAGGLWNAQGYYDSWLNAAKAIADEFVIAKSDEQLVMKDASFPYTIEASTECPDCTGGHIQICTSCKNETCTCDTDHDSGANLALVKCRSCGGTGDRSRNPADRLIAPPDEMDKDLIKIVSPDTAINKLHIDRNKDLYNDIMRALHLNYIEEAQSGVAKDKDMETRYQFILKISNDYFDRLISGAITDILSLRNVTTTNGALIPSPTDFTIVKPTQFQIKSSYDLLSEYKEANDSRIPAYQLNAILDDFVDKRFGGNDLLKRKTVLINQMDILAVYVPADIQIALLNNAATPRDYQFHLRLPTFLDQLVREKGNDWFLNSTFDVIKAEVDRLFQTVKPAIPPIVTDNVQETRINV